MFICQGFGHRLKSRIKKTANELIRSLASILFVVDFKLVDVVVIVDDTICYNLPQERRLQFLLLLDLYCWVALLLTNLDEDFAMKSLIKSKPGFNLNAPRLYRGDLFRLVSKFGFGSCVSPSKLRYFYFYS